MIDLTAGEFGPIEELPPSSGQLTLTRPKVWCKNSPGSTPRIDGPFMRGPIPLWWIQKATHLPGKSLAAGTIIFFYCGLRRTYQTRVGITDIAKQLKISWPAANRAFVALEKAGLIEVTRKNGSKAQVRLVLNRLTANDTAGSSMRS